MRKHILFVLGLFLLVAGLKAQNNSCPGLKNPQNFVMYSQYSGQTGIRDDGTSSYATSYMVMQSAIINNVALPTTVSSAYRSSSCRTGNDDAGRFVIKQAGNDPNANNMISYTPSYDPSFTSAIRLGNCYGDHEAEALYYTLDVRPENALVFIHYAIVLENALHGTDDNPEFIIRVKKETSPGVFVNISDTLCYIVQSPTSSSNLGSWQVGGPAVYKPWTKVAINLNNYLYQRVRIEMYVGDCSMTVHYGYCYIAGDCQPMQLQASDCAAGDVTEVATITAPKGLQSYRWQAKNELGNWVDLQDIQNNGQIIRTVNDSILRIQTVDFPEDQTTGGRVSTNDFKCIMTSAMDPSKPFTSWLQTTVNNKKPYMSITTSSECDGSVTFTDISVAPYVETEADMVDTSQSKWDFGDGSPIKIGGRVSHRYAAPGEYNVTLITTAANGTCFTEGARPATVRKRPPLDVVTSDTNICQGDRLRFLSGTDVQLYDYRWVVHRQDGHKDTILDDPELLWYFQDTSIVELTARNAAGCDTTVFKTIYVEEFPKLIIEGDTVVCNGTQSVINVSANLPNCTFGWYLDMENTTPNYTGSQMVRTPTQDETYYVKVTTPNGCVSWDSLHIRLMIPELTSDKVKICAYDTVQLIGQKAVTYEWTATPSDPSLVGQENEDTIYVTPLVNTTYKMVGLGNNGCRANPLTKNITVYPYPIPQLEYDPTFVDSEDPFITFNNLTVGATYTEWDFHDGKKMSGPTVTYEFKDFTIDSAYVTMTTSNEMGCTSDTTIAMPISIFAVWVPNAFTPDKSDNNLFRTYTGNDIRDYSLYIYDREGRQLFYTDDKEGTWDGTFNGKKCQQGVYVWVVSYRRLETDKVLQQKGTVVLLR